MQISTQFGQCSGTVDPYPELEYNVKIGEKQIYHYAKFLDTRQQNPNHQLRTYNDTNGELVTVLVQKGTRVEYKIVGISEPEITLRITIDDQVTYEETTKNGIIIMQTGSRFRIENTFNENETIRIEGNYIIREINDSSFIGDDGIFYNLDLYRRSIWDIDSGWLLNQHTLVSDAESTYYETEYEVIDFQARNSTTSIDNRLTRIGLLIIIIGLLSFIILYPRKNQE
ncbi:MAG: hypothetical protein ACFE9L_02350 [Candidatus Hodarchaeota archaeon]